MLINEIKIGSKIVSKKYGLGIVKEILGHQYNYPIIALFENATREGFTKFGNLNIHDKDIDLSLYYDVLTVEGRLKVYRELLDEYHKACEYKDPSTPYGFCTALKNKSPELKLGSFPELLEQKPKVPYDNNFWFPENDKIQRINCLQAAIAICDKLLLPENKLDINILSLVELENLKEQIEKRIRVEQDQYLDLRNASSLGLKDKILIQNRLLGSLKNKSFYLCPEYNWELVKDDTGVLCLLPTKKI